MCVSIILACGLVAQTLTGPGFFLPRIPLCTLINQHLSVLARKFPQTKFLKSISTTCIPNYPDRNLPTVFVYFEGDMKAQFIGPLVFGGMNLKVEGESLCLWYFCMRSYTVPQKHAFPGCRYMC